MPRATTGEEAGSIYRYFTEASQEEVKDYYVKTMRNQGWKIPKDLRSVSQEEKFIYVSFSNNNGGYMIELLETGFREAGTIYIYEADGFTHVMILLNPIMLTPSSPA